MDALSLATVCSDGRCIAHRLTQSTLKVVLPSVSMHPCDPIPQECGSWSDISDVLVGNFAGLGRKQLLALKHNGSVCVSICLEIISLVFLTGTEGKQFIATDLTLFSTEESKVTECKVLCSCMGSVSVCRWTWTLLEKRAPPVHYQIPSRPFNIEDM